MCYQEAAVFSVWKLMEDWEVAGSSPDSIEKALQVVSSRLSDKVAWTAAGTMGWIFLTALKANWIVPSVMPRKCASCKDETKSWNLAYVC